MPNSRSSEVRIKVIDRCLSDKKRKFTTEMMFDLCNEELERRDFKPITSKNSIRNDMEQIQRLYPNGGIIRIREGRNIYHRYEDPDFSIYRPALKPDEIIQLTQTITLLKRFKGMPQFDWVNEIAERLGTTLKIDETSTDEVVGFDENMDLEGLKNFTPLFNAIISKQTLNIKYQNFKSDSSTEFIVHPYYLKQYNKRWFLFAWDNEHNYLAIFAFDRILKIKEAKIPYRPTDIDFQDYFDEMVGVSKDTRTTPQLVKIRVSPISWPYIKTKPLHGTQKTISENAAGAVITIEVYLNYELEQLLMSFGENIEVLEPVELRDSIKERLTRAANNYLE
ncbi:MAG: WYL domain-containing protein [Bacteroidales bacterium]|nr:WYL domain-containing protein [Bacteroidales bacterium]